jgi:hypothetical protein
MKLITANEELKLQVIIVYAIPYMAERYIVHMSSVALIVLDKENELKKRSKPRVPT